MDNLYEWTKPKWFTEEYRELVRYSLHDIKLAMYGIGRARPVNKDFKQHEIIGMMRVLYALEARGCLPKGFKKRK